MGPDVRELLISEGVQVTSRPQSENNHQGNQMLLLIRNVSVEVEEKIRTIKLSVQPESESRHPVTFLGIIGGTPSIQMDGLDSRFQSRDSNYMMS